MAPRPPQDFSQFGSGAVGGPGAPPRPPYPPRPVAASIPYGGSGAAAQFTTGNLLNEAFTIFFQNFLPFCFITAVVLTPAIAVEILVVIAKSRAMTSDAQATMDLVATIPRLLFAALPPIAHGPIAYGVFQQLRGKHVPFAECVSVGFSRLLPVAGTAIVMTVAMFAGYMACCIPGIFLSVILFAAVPAAIVERGGVFGSMNRSIELSDGFRWSIFGLIFAIGVIGFLLGIVAAFVLIAGEGVLGVQIFGTLVQGAMQTLVVALQATGAALVYYRLRNIKESIDANELASVFD